MENDPNKKESKGKRLFKKAIRRNSRSSNSSQNSSQNVGVSRSKSFENKRLSIEINDSTPLPTPDGASETADGLTAPKLKIEEKTSTKIRRMSQDRHSELKLKKTVGINEEQNKIFEEEPPASSKDVTDPVKFIKPESPLLAETSKNSRKRVSHNLLYQPIDVHCRMKVSCIDFHMCPSCVSCGGRNL